MTHHILVVDDEPDVEILISQKFRRQVRSGEYKFSFAVNGAEAYQQIAASLEIDDTTGHTTGHTTNDIDIVLTDINMPVMDGLALISQLNRLKYPPKTVVVSAYSDIQNIRAAMNNGAFDFVTKPINFQDLVATIDKTIRAITKEKAAQHQLHQAQVQLVQSEKMSALGQMVAGVAHEINNPVNFIYGNIEPAKIHVQDLLTLIEHYQQAYPEPAVEVQSFLDEVELDFVKTDLKKLLCSLDIGAKRIRELVLSLKNFSRLDEAKKREANIHDGIDSTLLLLGNRIKTTANRPEVRIIKAYGELQPVQCYPSQLNQVIMNLLANALDAFEEQNVGRTFEDIEAEPNIIRIETALLSPEISPEISLDTSSDTSPEEEHSTVDSWIRIAIADNGPGLTPDTQAKLFDPFFTTKPIGKGTGLGLSISQQIIVEKHGGQLSCQSVLGQGTQFTIELPVKIEWSPTP